MDMQALVITNTCRNETIQKIQPTMRSSRPTNRKRPVTEFGVAVELDEALGITPEISPELASELSQYGTDGDNLGRRSAPAMDG